MATFTETLELLITSSTKGAVSGIKETSAATEELSGAQKVLGAGQSFVTGKMQQFGLSAEQSGTAMKVAAVGAGALAAVEVGKWAFDAASGFASMTGEVRGFQRVTGASATDASGLVAVTKALGISTQSAETGFFQLGKRIATGTDTLNAYGAEVVRNKDGSVDMTATLESAAAAFQKIEDPAKRDTFVMENFGRGGAALIPILSKSRDELAALFEEADKHHEIFTQAQLEEGRQFTLSVREAGFAVQGLKTEVGAFVAPIFTAGINQATKGIETFDSGLQAAGGSLGELGGGVGAVVSGMNPLSNVINAVSGVTDLFSGNFGKASGEIVKSLPVVGNLVQSTENLFGVFDGGSDSTNKLADAQSALKTSTQTMSELSAEGKTNTKAFADAQDQQTTATKTLTDAQNALRDATQGTAAAELQAIDQHLQLAAANLSVEGSMLNVRDALTAQSKAQTDANNAAQFGVDQSGQVEAAHIKTEQAILGVVDAAQKRAVQALGPSATAEQQHKAAVDATTAALSTMAGTVPGVIDELSKLGYKVITLPNGEIVVTANTTPAEQALAALRDQISSFIAFANQPGAFGPFGTGASARSVGAQAYRAPAGAAAFGVEATPGVEILLPTNTADAYAMPSGPSGPVGPTAATSIVINVTAGGLGADAPEIQRAIVAALRGYVGRNGLIAGIAA